MKIRVETRCYITLWKRRDLATTIAYKSHKIDKGWLLKACLNNYLQWTIALSWNKAVSGSVLCGFKDWLLCSDLCWDCSLHNQHCWNSLYVYEFASVFDRNPSWSVPIVSGVALDKPTFLSTGFLFLLMIQCKSQFNPVRMYISKPLLRFLIFWAGF